MSRARILADYVSSGDELALKAPIAGPTFTGTVGGLGTPVINLGSATGAIPAGVTGGAGLLPVSEVVRTSLTSPNTITATCTLADTLDSAGSISADLFGSSSVTLFGGVSQTNAAITFDYGSGVTKYLRYIEWYQVDGAGNSTGIKIRGSDNGTSWTDITTITSAIVNGTTYSFTNTGTTGYRYWQVQYTWSSANRGNVQDFIIHESDVSSVTNLSPATTFPAGHVVQTVHQPYGYQFQFNTTTDTETIITNGSAEFKVAMTPVDHTNYFLIDMKFEGAGNTSGSTHQANIGFTIRENSDGGTAIHVKDTSGNEYKGDGARTGTDQLKDKQMAHLGYDRAPDAYNNLEGIRNVSINCLTRLGNQSATGEITWSVYHYTGEIQQTFVNSAQSVNTGDTWSIGSMSSITVQEIVKV